MASEDAQAPARAAATAVRAAPEAPRVVTVLDTSVASTNLGDLIIMDAVRRELAQLIPDAFTYSVASHEWMGNKSRGLLRKSDVAIAGGTNLLSSRMWVRAIWKLSPLDAVLCDNVVLMGCGWYQFQRAPDPYTRWLLRSVLSKHHLHSVRDSYTHARLRGIGVERIVNTGCPTLWSLTPDYCKTLPKTKAKDVVTTLNTYIKDAAADRELLRVLRAHYENVYLWVQTHADYDYARNLDPRIIFLEPSLSAYDRFLERHADLDYAGNRLHGGIRALQHGRRAIIVEVDNRAREMGRDFGLPTVERDAFERLASMIAGSLEIRVQPPTDAIEQWRAQFRPRG